MSRFLRLALRFSLLTTFVTLVLSPQIAHANFLLSDPIYCATCSCGCASGGSSAGTSPIVCFDVHDQFTSFVSLTEGNVAEEYSVAQVRSAFGVTLDFHLIYNSYDADGSRNMWLGPGSTTDTVMGYGWTHMYNDFLFSQQAGDMFRFGPDGRITRFALQSDGSYKTTPGYFETLVKNGDGSFDLTTKYQTDYHYESIPGTPFQVNGPVLRLTSITDRNHNVTTLTYTSGNLTLITDTYGRSFQLAYNSNHHLTTVIDPLGNATTFTYNAAGNLLLSITDPANKTTTYTYNARNQITSKTDRDGRLFTFLYQHNLPYSELDGNGNPFYSLTNAHNWAIDPVQSLQTLTRVYIPSTTFKTDGNGNVWKYSYDSNAHALTVVAPDNATTTYTYDPATLEVASVTDADGHPPTTYTYDAEGNMLTKTDALGHVTTYTYDSTFNQMLSMTDPQGRVTTYTIDGHGNRTSETDTLNGMRRWTYDSHGNILTETDKDGNTTTYTYDPYGNRSQATDALGDLTKYTYDIMGNLTSVTDADGNTTHYRYEYHARYQVVLQTDALGGLKHYFYDGEGDEIEVIDENGNPTFYVYDLRRRLVTVTDALGGVITYTYDGNNNKLSMTDQDGHTTAYLYDVQNRLIKTTDALGDMSKRSYDPVGNLLSETDADNHTTTYLYDALNRRIQKTDALGEITMWVYDRPFGSLPGHPECTGPTLGSSLVVEQIDGNGKVIYYCYDGLDRLIIEIHKQNGTAYVIVPGVDAVTFYTYDPNSNRLTMTEPDGNTTTYSYDGANRRVKMVNAAGDITLWTYDPVGNILTITWPNGNVTTYTYDPLNRKKTETDSDGPVGTWSYDPVGNVVGTTDGDGHPTSYTYDALNRRVTMTDALGQLTQYFYDPVGNLLKVLDREGNPTKYTYDAINRRLTVTDAQQPQPGTTQFQYDPVGNLLAITDANNHTTTFAYDAVNRLLCETYPDPSHNTICYTYDLVGNVITRTDQKSQITTYAYSDLYFLLSRTYSPSGSTDTYTYDLSGRVLTGLRSTCVPACLNWNETFAYDGANRLLQSVQNSQPISYLYNIPARTRTLTYPSGRTIVEQKDFRDFRLASINDGGSSPIVQYAYDPANNVLTRGYRNGTVATSTYNANNWVCSINHNLGSNLIVGFTYAYDNEGNKFYEQKLHETNDSEAYTYDPIYRLIDYKAGMLASSPPPNCPTSPQDVPVPVTQTAYNLDKLGNWNSIVVTPTGIPQNRTHSPSNEITSINGRIVGSDFDGNTTLYAGATYSYDEENRLYQAKSGGNVLGQYFYDAFGRRVSKIDNFSVQTFYYYDWWRTIEEQSSPGVTQATYVFGDYLDEALTMDRGGATYYYHQNALWSTFALTDSNGNGVEGYQYDAYGYQTLVLPGTDGILDFDSDDVYLPGAKSSVGNPFLFTGQRYDPETGLPYYKHRYYSTFFGRFLQRDRLEYVDGYNLYAYVSDRPTAELDPSGQDPSCYLANKNPNHPKDVDAPNPKDNTFQTDIPPRYDDNDAGALGVCTFFFKCTGCCATPPRGTPAGDDLICPNRLSGKKIGPRLALCTCFCPGATGDEKKTPPEKNQIPNKNGVGVGVNPPK